METKVMEADVKAIRVNGNVRAIVDKKEAGELMASIKKHGLLSPLIVRENDGTGDKAEPRFILVAGHRRLAAIQALGLSKVKVIITEADEDTALEIQITENLQRADLRPVEEARAFQKLWELHPDLTAAGLANRVDKTVPYVARALSLLVLSDKTLKLIDAGDLPPEHGHQIARIEGKARDTIERFATTKNEWYKRYPTLDELKREIEKTVERPLDKAVFPLDVANYGGTTKPACLGCPQNTGNQETLFDGAKAGNCTGPACYQKRTAHWYGEFEKQQETRLDKVKFVGAVVDNGYLEPGSFVKGYPLVDEKKTRAALKDHPEKFGFVILKPGRYSNRVKPTVAVVSLDKKAKPAAREPERDWERERFTRDAASRALIIEAWKKDRALNAAELRTLVSTFVDGAVVSTIDAFEKPVKINLKTCDMKTLFWLARLSANSRFTSDVKQWDALGIDAKQVYNAAVKVAADAYDKKKAGPKPAAAAK